MLAAACDRIAMPPSGVLVIPGVRAEITFFKGLLDKLGLEFDVLKMGKYKGALEPFTRNEMSKPLRESYEALVEDNYQDLLSVIAADRHLKDYQVKTYVDRSLFTADDAKKAGLIDDVLYADQLEDAIKKDLKGGKVEVVANYKKHKIDADFSGLGGMMKLIEIFSGGKPSAAVSKKPKIAVVYAVGPIMEGKGDGGMFGSSVIGSTPMVAALKKAADDPKVVAIVLRIDSPGGSAVASDLIWRETVRIEEAGHRQHGRRGRQRRILHRHGREEDLRRPLHVDRLDRRDRRQTRHSRAVRQTGPAHRSDRPRRQQRRDVVRRSRSRPASGRCGSSCCRTRTISSSARPPKGGR